MQANDINHSIVKENWVRFDEFLNTTGLSAEVVKGLILRSKINAKYVSGVLYVDSVSGTNEIIKNTHNTFVANSIDAGFVEQSIGTILSLHDKVVEAKNETIAAIKNENQFLKDALASAKESQLDDKKIIDELRQELEAKKQELEAVNRKYKLMWIKC